MTGAAAAPREHRALATLRSRLRGFRALIPAILFPVLLSACEVDSALEAARPVLRARGEVVSTDGEARRVAGRLDVADGDSLRIDGERIRLFGIDAPEPGQECTRADGGAYDCGEQASRFLHERVRGREVRCVRVEQDEYGRTVARCTLAGEDLAGLLVRNGWALAYRRYSRDYVPEEEQAERARAGIWSGRFVPPWKWRAANRRPRGR